MKNIISIVVPVYNAQEYLDECIDSVICQTSSEWELILVDDGSTDESGAFCDKYALSLPEKIKVFHNGNHGQFYSRKFGIGHCSGKYIGFLDADDFLDKRYVEMLKKCTEENNAPDIVCFGFCRWDGKIIKNYFPDINNKKNFLFEKASLKDFRLSVIEARVSGSMWSNIFKADLIKNTNISDDEAAVKRFGEDAYYSYSLMANATKVYLLDETLYYYRYNERGASFGYTFRDMEYFNTRYVFDVVHNSLSKWNMNDDDNSKRLYANNFNSTVYHLLKFYRSAETKERKKEIVDFDWERYLIKNSDEIIKDNPYVRQSYIKVWEAFKNKKYLKIALKEKYKKFLGW